MMIGRLNIQMVRLVVFALCWLLAAGRGSGLTGSTSIAHDSMTSHTTSLPLRVQTAEHKNRVGSSLNKSYPLANVSLSFYPLPVHNGKSVHKSELRGDILSRTGSSQTIATPPTHPLPENVERDAFHNVNRTSYTTYSDTSSSVGGDKNISILTKDVFHNLTSQKLNLEVAPELSQSNSQSELFIRKKHEGSSIANGLNPKIHSSVSNYKTTDSSILARIMSNPKRVQKRPLNMSNHFENKKNITSVLKLNTTTELIPHKKQNTTVVYETPLKVHRKEQLIGRARKHMFSMGIPASSRVSTVLLGLERTTSPAPPLSSVDTFAAQDSDEYYSSYAEYPDLAVNTFNGSGYNEAAVLPDPDIATDDEEVPDTEPDVVLPDDSLADTDLHDHDLIDSVMYIYFGSSERDERGAGRQVLIVGAVISLVAQFLTLVSVLRRLRSRPDESASLILINAELALTAGNLVFMLGVQATGNRKHCEFVAVTLHYLHLATCSWFFVNCIYAYRSVEHPEQRTRLRPWWLVAWLTPAVVVLACFLLNRRGYESRSYCWMSIERGMLYSFMVPVAVLILLNTLFAVMGLRRVTLSSAKKAEEGDRKSLRVAATLLPGFAVVWFLGVVALENSASLVFPLLFVASSGFLNWFVFACWLPVDMSIWRESDEEYDEDDDDLYEEVLKTQTPGNDSQPLLEDSHIYVCGRRDMCELQMDPICTISS